ncbi:hypothetical protein D3C79_786880 [compost metagenome]
MAVFRRTRHLLHAAKAQASRFHRVVALALFQLNQQLLALQFRFLFSLVALNQLGDAIFDLVERLNTFRLVARDADHEGAIAINGDHVGVAAR